MGDGDHLGERPGAQHRHAVRLVHGVDRRDDEAVARQKHFGVVVKVELHRAAAQAEHDGLLAPVPLVHKAHPRRELLVDVGQRAVGAVQALHDLALKEAQQLKLAHQLARQPVGLGERAVGGAGRQHVVLAAQLVGARRGVPGVHGVDERDKLLDDGDEHAALLELDGIEVHLGLVARRSGVRGRVRRGRTREEIVVAARQLVDTADDLVDGEAQQRPPVE